MVISMLYIKGFSRLLKEINKYLIHKLIEIRVEYLRGFPWVRLALSGTNQYARFAY